VPADAHREPGLLTTGLILTKPSFCLKPLGLDHVLAVAVLAELMRIDDGARTIAAASADRGRHGTLATAGVSTRTITTPLRSSIASARCR
jgi:hypothetical protein